MDKKKGIEVEGPSMNSINIIGQGTEIKGDINISSDMRIDGRLNGNFYSNQKLVVGASGFIEGTITCKDCDVFGTITGNLYISEQLTLRPTANIKGDIATNKIVMELNAQFSGGCKTRQNIPQIGRNEMEIGRSEE